MPPEFPYYIIPDEKPKKPFYPIYDQPPGEEIPGPDSDHNPNEINGSHDDKSHQRGTEIINKDEDESDDIDDRR